MGPCLRRGDDLEEAGWPFHIITSCSSSLFEHDLRANAFRVCREGKPLHTFPDHALVVAAIRQLAVMGEIAEAGDRGIEVQLDRAGRTMALLADDDFGPADRALHVCLPFGVFLGAGTRLLH